MGNTSDKSYFSALLIERVGSQNFLQSWKRKEFHALEIASNVLKYTKLKESNCCSTLKRSPANPIVLKKSPSSANRSLEKTDEFLTSTRPEIEWMIPTMMPSSFLVTILIFLSEETEMTGTILSLQHNFIITVFVIRQQRDRLMLLSETLIIEA